MFSLSASFVVVYFSPADPDGNYPDWVYFYAGFAVIAYQVGSIYV